MFAGLLPLVVCALAGAAEPAAATVVESGVAAGEMTVADHVAQTLADADQVLAVHQVAGAVVFDLDLAGERFQLTVAIDDDGRTVASTLDWAGPAGDVAGVMPAALRHLPSVEQIDAAGAAVILRGGGMAVTLGGPGTT